MTKKTTLLAILSMLAVCAHSMDVELAQPPVTRQQKPLTVELCQKRLTKIKALATARLRDTQDIIDYLERTDISPLEKVSKYYICSDSFGTDIPSLENRIQSLKSGCHYDSKIFNYLIRADLTPFDESLDSYITEAFKHKDAFTKNCRKRKELEHLGALQTFKFASDLDDIIESDVILFQRIIDKLSCYQFGTFYFVERTFRHHKLDEAHTWYEFEFQPETVPAAYQQKVADHRLFRHDLAQRLGLDARPAAWVFSEADLIIKETTAYAKRIENKKDVDWRLVLSHLVTLHEEERFLLSLGGVETRMQEARAKEEIARAKELARQQSFEVAVPKRKPIKVARKRPEVTVAPIVEPPPTVQQAPLAQPAVPYYGPPLPSVIDLRKARKIEKLRLQQLAAEQFKQRFLTLDTSRRADQFSDLQWINELNDPRAKLRFSEVKANLESLFGITCLYGSVRSIYCATPPNGGAARALIFHEPHAKDDNPIGIEWWRKKLLDFFMECGYLRV